MARGRGSRNHPHKYHLIDLGRDEVFACALPDCTHYMPKHMEQMLIGKRAECWGCGDKFAFEEKHLAMKKPLCDKCANPDLDAIASLLKESAI